MSDLSRPTYYCTRCRQIKPMAPSNDPLCPTCPEEPLVDVSDPEQRQSVLELEADALDRHTYKWMAGVGVGSGLIGIVLAWVIGDLLGIGGELFWTITGLAIVGGVALGRLGARWLWTRAGRAMGLDEALERAGR